MKSEYSLSLLIASRDSLIAIATIMYISVVQVVFWINKRRRWPILSLVILVVSLWPTTSLAHGGGEPQLANVEVGPYHLYLWSLPEPPRVGEIHLTVAVTKSEAATTSGNETQSLEEPVLDAEVEITLESLDRNVEPISVAATLKDAAFAIFYEADTQLTAAGRWQGTVTVAAAEGKGSATFEMNLQPDRILNWPLILGIGVGIAALIGISRLVLRNK